MSGKCKISLIAPACFALLTLRADPGDLCIVDDFEDGELFDGDPLVWEWYPGFQLEHTVEDGDLVMFGGPNVDDTGILFLPEFEGWQDLRMECSMVGRGDIGLINGSPQAQYWASVFADGDVGITKCTGSPPGPVECRRLRNGPDYAIPESTHHIEFHRSGSKIEVTYWDVGVEPPAVRSLVVLAPVLEGGSPGIWYYPSAPGSRGIIHWFEVCFSQPAVFRRGDTDGSGIVDISDPIYNLAFQFVGGVDDLPCEDAADVDDSGVIDISDPIYNLTYQFVGGIEPPPMPGQAACGVDPTEDDLTCAMSCPAGG